MRIQVGDDVRILRDIERNEGHYVSAGALGTVLEVFASDPSGDASGRRLNAKLLMADRTVKAVRLTTIERVGRTKSS